MEGKSSKIKERVLQIAECKGIAKERFFEKIGMTYGNFKGKSKETPLNSTAIENIYAIYPDINLEWLITGKGDMLKEDVQKEDVFDDPTQENMALKDKVIQLQDEISSLKSKIIVMQQEQLTDKAVRKSS